MNWKLPDDVLHVVPINEKDGHIESMECNCRPYYIMESGRMIVVHGAYDGREGVEWANKILYPDQNSKK